MTGDLQRLAADIRNLQENMSAKAGTSIRKPVAESNVAQQPVMKQNAVVQPMTETIDVYILILPFAKAISRLFTYFSK